MTVFPPPVFAITSMFASLKPGSKGEKGMSIREDGLITLAAHGIVFASGKAGTLQEIFQDSVRNYYRSAADPFSPMVFFGKTYWTEKLPAAALLQALFRNAGREKEYTDNVLIT